MSNKALNWAWDSDIETPGAKFVLVALADHAGDHNGEDWTCYPSMQRLAAMTAQGERTVERHLAWLVEQGWISRNRRPGRHRGDGVYQYVLHRARALATPANLAGGQPAAGDEPPANLAGGQEQPPANFDTTTRQFRHDHPPISTNPPAPPYKAEPSLNPHKPAPAGAMTADQEAFAKPWFDKLAGAWGKVSPGRTAPRPAWRAFKLACQQAAPERIHDAGIRYLAQDPDVRRLGPYRLHAWLDEGRFQPWLVAPDKAEERPRAWAGPAEIRAAVVAQAGEDFARSYLDQASWDPAGIITTRTAFACGKLQGLQLRDLGVLGVQAATAKVGA